MKGLQTVGTTMMTKKLLARFVLLGAALIVAACGGGGDEKAGEPLLKESAASGAGGSTNSGTAVPSDLVLVLSASTIINTGAQPVTATVTALDAKRNVLSGVQVALSVDANATIAPGAPSTDASGVITGEVGIGSDRSNRTITVTATAGTLVRTAQLQVTDTPTAAVPLAADLTLSLSASRLVNTGTGTVLATVTAVDANRNALAGVPVTIKVDESAVAIPSGSTTSASGVVTATVGIGANRSNRVVTVTAVSGSLTRSSSFVVFGADLRVTYAPRVNAGSTANSVEFTLVDASSQPMAAEVISVSGPGVPSANGVTDSNGKYLFSYDAPSTATALTLTAIAAGASKTATIEIGSGTVDPAPSPPISASITPSPSVIGVNLAGSSTNKVELRALFLGSNNLPIPRVRARFDLAGNANNTDGTVSWFGGAYAYSDSTGVARGTFTPGQRSSPAEGVTVRVCYDISDFDTSTCPNSRTAKLTVAAEAFSVSLRTNEVIKVGSLNLTYIKEFVVMVVDSAGRAIPDVPITPYVDLPEFRKGFYTFNVPRSLWEQSVVANCVNEDENRNGVSDLDSRGNVEDRNENSRLDPPKSDVAVKMVGSEKTDSSGLAVVQIEYGKSVATWITFNLKVSARGILGTESSASLEDVTPAPSDALSSAAPPAFKDSPFGLVVGPISALKPTACYFKD